MFIIAQVNTLFTPFIYLIRPIDISANIFTGISVLNSNRLTGRMNITDDVHPDILPDGLSIATYTSGSKNAPSSYGTVLYMSYNNSGNKWYSAIAFPTESSYIFFSFKTNEKNWSNWITK